MKIREEIDKHFKKEYWGNEDCFEECYECPYPLGDIRCGDD